MHCVMRSGAKEKEVLSLRVCTRGNGDGGGYGGGDGER